MKLYGVVGESIILMIMVNVNYGLCVSCNVFNVSVKFDLLNIGILKIWD